MGIKLKDHINEKNMKLSRSEIKEFLIDFLDPIINEYGNVEANDFNIEINGKLEYNGGFAKIESNHLVENVIKEYKFKTEFTSFKWNSKQTKYLKAA